MPETFPQSSEQPASGLIELPDHLRQEESNPDPGERITPELITGIPDHLRAGIEDPTTPTEEDSAAPSREPIVVSSPGDPGYDQLLAKYQARQALLSAASESAAKMYGPPKA